MSDNFTRALDIVFKFEGGFSDDKNDSGGATNYGISLNNNPDLTLEQIKKLTKKEASEIYKVKYWNPIKADCLKWPLSLAMFDFSVHSGPERAIRFIQKIIGVEADSIIGPQTLAKINEYEPHDLALMLTMKRIDFLKRNGIGKNLKFLKGWLNRAASVVNIIKKGDL